MYTVQEIKFFSKSVNFINVQTHLSHSDEKMYFFNLILYILQIIFFFFSLYVFCEPEVHFHNFLLCCPSQRSARSQVPSQVATHQEIGSQLWAGETPNSNPGLQDNSLAHYH
jgi:hypothetical protein